MAVSVDTEPQKFSPVHNPVKWGLTLTSTGTDPNVIKLGLQLYVDGSAITEEKFAFPPVNSDGTPQEAFFEFSRLLQGYVNTMKPFEMTHNGLSEDTKISADVVLHYGEITTNTDTCETTVSIGSTSNTVTIFNAALQFYESNEWSGASPGPIWMTDRPSIVPIARNSIDWVWIYGSDTVTLRYLDKDKSQISSAPTNTTASKFNVLGVNIDGIVNNDIKFVEVQDGGGSVMWTYVLRPPCKRAKLYFLEPKGGFALLTFDERSTAVSSQHSEVYTNNHLITDGLSDRTKTGGIDVRSGGNYEKITLSGTFPPYSDWEDFLTKARASKEMYVVLDESTVSSSTVGRFIPDAGEFNVLPESGLIRVSVTGKLHKEHIAV